MFEKQEILQIMLSYWNFPRHLKQHRRSWYIIFPVPLPTGVMVGHVRKIGRVLVFYLLELCNKCTILLCA